MFTKNFEFENGNRVEDKVSGFSGTITGVAFYLTGCTSYLITSESINGKEPVSLWYDEGRIELISEGITPEEVKAEENGCDMMPPVGKRGF